LLLFGVPFAASYLATRPVPPSTAVRGFIVCAYPTDRPGELQISLEPADCTKKHEAETRSGVQLLPTVRSTPERTGVGFDQEMSVPF
jgi:CRISPR-associated Cas5-like protein